MSNRPRIRELTATARALLREASRLAEGDLETVRETLQTAAVASTDALDALQEAQEADLREWADLHCEDALELAAEARGDC